jgi:hypothetical protein
LFTAAAGDLMHGCGPRWPCLSRPTVSPLALLIGGASAPQAAVSGFGGPYAIPDTATAALGILLAITILATAGRMSRRVTAPEGPRPRG